MLSGSLKRLLAPSQGSSHKLGAWLAGSRGLAVETGPQQTDAPNPKKPFVQEDSQGTIQQQKEVYESMVAQSSGVAEDVRVKDEAPTTLGKMMKDPRGPENERVKGARDMAASSEREMESQEVADVVFDDKKSTQEALSDVSPSASLEKEPSTATPPQ